jgi:hypothetical protein
MKDNERLQEEALTRAIARLRSGVMASVFAMTSGTGLWLATVWLVLRGGPNVGKHLGLLRHYFPGYSVTWAGAFIGFVYAALVGGLVGFLLAWIYNRLVAWRAESNHSA